MIDTISHSRGTQIKLVEDATKSIILSNTPQTALGILQSTEAKNSENKVIGKGRVIRLQDNLSIETVIKELAPNNEKKVFFAEINDQGVGYITLHWLRMKEDGKWGNSVHDEETISPYYGYEKTKGAKTQPENKYQSKVYIAYLESSQKQKYKGIGSLLFQVAIEHSINLGCEGRVQLTAVRNSHGFHYKQGMRSGFRNVELNPKKSDKTIENYINILPYVEHGILEMYLPNTAIETWKKKIQAHPILQKND